MVMPSLKKASLILGWAFFIFSTSSAQAGEVKPAYETMNQYRETADSLLLWGSVNEVFIRVKASRVAAYPGEAIEVRYDLLSRVPSHFRGVTELEKVYDVAKVEIPQSNLKGKVRRSMFFKDRQYRVDPIRKFVLFAQKKGTVVFFPGVIRVAYQRDNSGTWIEEDFKAEDQLDVTIEDFPLAGQPEGFQGLCGSFKVQSRVDTSKFQDQGTVDWIVDVTGIGGLDLLALPAVELPEGLLMNQVFQPETRPFFDAEGRVKMTKSFRAQFRPKEAGTYTIPSISIDFFDSKVKKYEKAFAGPVGFTVDAPPAASSEERAKEPVKAEESSIKSQTSEVAPADESAEPVVSEVKEDDANKEFHGIKNHEIAQDPPAVAESGSDGVVASEPVASENEAAGSESKPPSGAN